MSQHDSDASPGWRLTLRRLNSRDGKLLIFEAAIYLGALVLAFHALKDWVNTGSTMSGWTFVLITLYGHWPLLRNRLRRGDWPG